MADIIDINQNIELCAKCKQCGFHGFKIVYESREDKKPDHLECLYCGQIVEGDEDIE